MSHDDRTGDLQGEELLSLVVAIETAIGHHAAGRTALGAEIIRLCEERLSLDRVRARHATELERPQ